MEENQLIEAICRHVITNHALPSEIDGISNDRVLEYTRKLTHEKIINNETQKMKIRDTRSKEYQNLTVNKGMLTARYSIKI